MSQYGVPQEDIAAVIEVSVETMVKLYGAELRKGKAMTNAKVGERLFKKCEDGDTTALIFWAKTQMKWKETQRVETYTPGVAEFEQKALDARDRLLELRAERAGQASRKKR